MNEIFNIIEDSKQLVIELQKELTKRKAVNPDNGGQGEYEKFLFLKEYLSSWGFDELQEIYAPDNRVESKIRPSLIATIRGNEATTRSLWIITHLDVVPEGDLNLWKTPPFEAVIEGDYIYGRGVEDNQQGLVSSLVAAKALLTKKIKPTGDIKLLFVADEEVGSDYGIQYILDNTDYFNKDDIIITPDVGDPKGEFIETAEKSILWANFEISGKQSHGSRPDLGINAARASAHLTVRLEELFNRYNAIDERFDLPYSTFEPTKKIGYVDNINTIPGHDTFCFDCRILPEYDLNKIVDEIKNLSKKIEEEFKVSIEISYPQKVQAPTPTPDESDVVFYLKTSIKKITGKDASTYGIGGGTVAAYFRMKGYQAALWSTLDNTMHAPNEYSKISNTLSDAKVFADIMMSFK